MKKKLTTLKLGSTVLITVMLSLCLSACLTQKQQAQVVHLDTISISARNNPLAIYRATTPTVWDITHIEAELLFNFNARTANGLARYVIRNTRNLSAHELQLTLDAKSMQILGVESEGNNLPYTYEQDKLRIDVSSLAQRNFSPFSFNPADSFTAVMMPVDNKVPLQIRYVSMPYEQAAGGSAAIREDRGLYFINTNNDYPGKPVQIWTQGETEANSKWLPLIDKPNERFTMKLSLTLPDSLQSLSNGTRISSKKSGSLRTDIWESKQPLAAYLISIAIGKYANVSDRIAVGKPVNYYVENQFAPYAKNIFQHTPEMMEFFSQATGVPFPWDKYSQVTVRDFVAGAMENTSASTFGDFVQKNVREIKDSPNDDIVAHELFHQWFGDLVTAESWSNITLNESFATFGEYLWKGFKYGIDAADEKNINAINAYLQSATFQDAPLARYHYRSREVVFDRISYQKGGAILRHLNDIIGDDAMRRAMQIYLTKNAHQPAEIANWRIAVEEAYGEDMNWFFKQWYEKEGYPLLQIQHIYQPENQQLLVVIKQEDSSGIYRLPLTAAVVFGKELRPLRWEVMNRLDTLRISYEKGVAPLFIPNYKSTLVGTISEEKSTNAWLQQLNVSGRGMNRLLALKQIVAGKNKTKTEDSILREAIATAMDDSFPTVRKQAITALEQVYKTPAAQQPWLATVQALAHNDIENAVRARAIQLLGAWKVKMPLTLWQQWVDDSSYIVAGAALQAWYLQDSLFAYQVAKKIVQQNPRAQLKQAAWQIVAQQGVADDLHLFGDFLPEYQFKEDLQVLSSLLYYMRNVSNENVFAQGVNLLQQMIKATSFSRTRLSAVQSIQAVFLEPMKGMGEAQAEKIKKMESAIRELRDAEKNANVIKLYDKILRNGN